MSAEPTDSLDGSTQQADVAKTNPRRRVRLTPYLFLAPSILIVGGVLIYPMGDTIRRAFLDWPFGQPSETTFVGLDNFGQLLDASEGFMESLGFTAVFVVVTIILEFILAMAGAWLIHGMVRGRSFVATAAVAPYMVAPVAVGLVWQLILTRDAGVLNWILGLVGIDPVNWISEPRTAALSVMIAEVWRSMPFVLLILLAGLSGIPEDVIEAGKVDGASDFQVFRFIVRPLLMPAIAVALLFETIFKLRVFDLVVTLTGGGPGSDTTPLGLYIYRMFFRYFDGGVASAACVVLLLIGIVITFLYMKYVYREVTY